MHTATVSHLRCRENVCICVLGLRDWFVCTRVRSLDSAQHWIAINLYFPTNCYHIRHIRFFGFAFYSVLSLFFFSSSPLSFCCRRCRRRCCFADCLVPPPQHGKCINKNFVFTMRQKMLRLCSDVASASAISLWTVSSYSAKHVTMLRSDNAKLVNSAQLCNQSAISVSVCGTGKMQIANECNFQWNPCCDMDG